MLWAHLLQQLNENYFLKNRKALVIFLEELQFFTALNGTNLFWPHKPPSHPLALVGNITVSLAFLVWNG